MIIACQNGDFSDIEALLLEFKQATCTHTHYTQVTGKSASPKSRSKTNKGNDDVLSDPSMSTGRGIFQTLTEGAGRAISGLWAATEQLLEDSFELIGEGCDGLMRQTYSSVVQLTQEYFNAMLITAIERQNSATINLLLDFGLNFCSISRPSAALGPAVGVWCPEIDESLCSSHQTNPVTLFVDSRHRSWLTLALEPRTDTALLAAARSLGAEEAFCKIFSKSPELSNLPGTDGILPIHLVSALGKADLLRHMLSFATADNSPLAYPLRSCHVNDMPALYASPFCVDMIDDNGMSAFLLACFYGHLECLRVLLDLRVAAEPILPPLPSDVQSLDSPITPVDEERGAGGEENDAEDLESGLLEPQPQLVCPIDFFRTVAVQWQFIADSRLSNVVLLNPEMHSQGRHICGQFGALHLAVMTGNLELTAFLLPYLAEDINKSGLPCGHAPPTTSLPPTPPTTSTPLCFVNKYTPELASALTTPLGLACCLSDVRMRSGDTVFPIVRFLVAVGAHDTKNALLHLLLQRGRFELAGLILSAAVNTQRSSTKCVAFPFGLDWSDMRLCAHLQPELHEPASDILGTLLLDWFSEAHWQAQLRATAFLRDDTVCCLESFTATPTIQSLENLTKLSLANNDLEYIPMCLFTQLPNIQISCMLCYASTWFIFFHELDLSRNHIKSLPDLWRTLTDGNSNPRLFCEHLRQLELSRNNLTSLPPWLFGAPITPSPSCSGGQSEQGPLVFGNFAPRLGVLRLGRNRIRTVPRHIWLAPCLFHLDLSENQIQHLPTLSNDEVVLATRNRALGRTSIYSFHGTQSTASFGSRLESLSISSSNSVPVSSADCLASLPRLPNALKLMSSLESSKEDCDHQTSSMRGMIQPSTRAHRWTGGLVHLWLQRNRLKELPLGSDIGLARQPAHKHSDSTLLGITSFSESPPSATAMATFMFDARLSHLAPNLVSLDASSNRLTDFGVPADYPSGLVVLDLANNYITSNAGQPGEKARLWFPQLTSLDLSGNADRCLLSGRSLDIFIFFSQLPPDLWRLDKLKSLTFFGTPAYEQLSKILIGGPSSPRPPTQHKNTDPGDRILNTTTVLTYLRALPRWYREFYLSASIFVFNYYFHHGFTSKPYTKIRLMVLGPPGVGKTAFVRSFCRAEQANAKHRNPRGSPITQAVSDSGPLPEHTDGQVGVRLTSLRISRKRPDTAAGPQPVAIGSDWCEDVTFTIWDFDGAVQRAGQMTRRKRRLRLRTGRPVSGDIPDLSPGETDEEVTAVPSAEEDEADAHAAALSAVQQFCLSRSAVYVVVWRATDGPRGLESISKFLVDIQCRAPLAPVFIIGTHRDLCPETLSTADEVEKCWSVTELNEIVYRRYFRYTDPAAIGLPSCLQGHVILDCKSSTSSAQSALSQLATLIHRAANQMRLSSRTTSGFLPHVKSAVTPGCASFPRFLGLLIPSFYHDLEEACRLLAADLRAANIPPIISLEDFISHAKSRLHQKLATDEPVGATDDTRNDVSSSSEESDFDSPASVRGAVAFLNEVGVLLHFTGATLGRAVVVDPSWLCGLLFRVLALGAEDTSTSTLLSESQPRRQQQLPPTVAPYFSVWRRIAPLTGHRTAGLNKIAPAVETPASVRSPNLSIRAGK
ncbi:unnamed protein product [Schistocephalus solidus]|uniref:Non-specific serine/threonine protein kinase n=1 Tax=Schistocephalus solidus TaxID=70667 RepID=A0A183T0V8_SCHSO|nr:unnamed protein product [Schistocephalus solidus]